MIIKCKICGGLGFTTTGDVFSGVFGQDKKPCPSCRGAGEFDLNVPDEKLSTCKFCGGRGLIGSESFTFLGTPATICSACKGVGVLERPQIGIEKISMAKPEAAPSPPDEPKPFIKNNNKENNRMASMAAMDNTVDIVIITALIKEQAAVMRHLGTTEEIKSKNRTYYKGTIPHDQGGGSYSFVVLSLPGMGNVQAAIATSQAITVWNPSQVILSGITAGIKDAEMNWNAKWLGDIIVAEQILGYEVGKVADGKTKPRYQVVRPAFNLVEAARNLSTEKWVLSAKVSRPDGSSNRIIPRLHFGVVASGEKIVADTNFAQELKSQWSQLAGIEMESYGTALAAYQSETVPGMFMVKGICDWADNSKIDEWQEYAADVSAAFLVAMLKRAPFTSYQRPQAEKLKPIEYSGKIKVGLSMRIGDDWKDLSDYFDIPPYKRDRFTKGREMQDVWEWLETRNKLDGLKDALSFINRHDLLDLLSSP